MRSPRLSTHLVAGLCAMALVAPAATRGADDGARADPLEAGLQCFADLDYACAVELLGAACAQQGLAPARLRLGLARLAESHLALGQREAAVAALLGLLEVEPGLALPDEAPPKLQAALEEARRRRAPAPAPAPVEAQAAPPAAEAAWLRLGLCAGGEFVLGEDAEHLAHGPLLGIEASFGLNDLVRVGLGLRWSEHGILAAQDARAVEALGAWLGVGLAGEVGPLGLSVGLGVGVHHFGVLHEEAKTGLWLPFHLGIDVRLVDWLRLGLGLAPALTLLPDERRASATLGLSAGLQFAL